MECHYCRGEMKKGTTSYTINRKGYHLIIEKIPAWVCQQCGEPYFEEAEVEAIQQLIRDMDKGVEALIKRVA